MFDIPVGNDFFHIWTERVELELSLRQSDEERLARQLWDPLGKARNLRFLPYRTKTETKQPKRWRFYGFEHDAPNGRKTPTRQSSGIHGSPKVELPPVRKSIEIALDEISHCGHNNFRLQGHRIIATDHRLLCAECGNSVVVIGEREEIITAILQGGDVYVGFDETGVETLHRRALYTDDVYVGFDETGVETLHRRALYTDPTVC